jgi:hypothetical protein
MKYGKNTNLVEEVLSFVEKGALLEGVSSEDMSDSTLIRDFAEAKSFAWSQDLSVGELPWVDLREREMRNVLRARYELPDLDAVDNELGNLVDILGAVVLRRLRGTFREIVDDVAGDLYNCAYRRAVLGYKEGLFEEIFDAYKSGGWPCGWKGNFPEGALVVFTK